ncbi:hypothetical protein [Saccharopolyspora dendranthemae]|nr:hypothetical protein [Saccharopolyspora dendranthemae]
MSAFLMAGENEEGPAVMGVVCVLSGRVTRREDLFLRRVRP